MCFNIQCIELVQEETSIIDGYKVRAMFGSNYNTWILILASESMGQMKWQTFSDSKVLP